MAIDLDLTSYLPQKVNVKAGTECWLIDSVQPPLIVERIGTVSRLLASTMTRGEATDTVLEDFYDLGAEILGVDVAYARERLEWAALMRLFAFLARPINDLQAAMVSTTPPSGSPEPLAATASK